MPRFICSHLTTSLIKHITPSGKVLAFDYRGVLDTDEEGAAVIRAHPLYGRVILDWGESTPAQPPSPSGRRADLSDSGTSAAPAGTILRETSDEGRSLFAHLSAPEPPTVRAPTPPGLSPRVETAVAFLRDVLPCTAREVTQASVERGIPWWAVRDAKDYLGARSVKTGLRTGWVWVFPAGERIRLL